MSQFESMNREQTEFEEALRQLRPNVSRLDPASLMYQAGCDAALQESQAQLRRWQISTFVTSACALLAVTMLWPGVESGSVIDNSVTTRQEVSETTIVPEQHSPESPAPSAEENSTTNSVVRTETPTENQTPSPADPESPTIAWWNEPSRVTENSTTSYIALRNQIMREGLDAFPDPDFSQETTSTGTPIQREPLSVRDAHDPELWNQI